MNGVSTICPCDTFVHPRTVSNPAGRSTISYRIGDYTSFREALLRSSAGEVELKNWRPGAQGDLAVQMVEWWAYLADILTFYCERIANEDYLRTAILPESVRGLIAILGYRPRPGIGATGTLAALMTGSKAFTLPKGFQISSKPGPGQQPQVFELDADTLVEPPDSISADPLPLAWVASDNSVLLKGSISGINRGDELLVLERNWTGQDRNYAVVTVQSVTPQKDPRGNTNTKVQFNESLLYLAGGDVNNYRLLRSSQSTHVWQYPAASVIATNQIDLASVTRGISVGDPILLEFGSPATARGIYFSPDGQNLAGGGNTKSLGALNRTVVQMLAYQSGVVSAFDDGTIYFSPGGQNLGGGGNTVLVYSGPRHVVLWTVYNGGVMTAFDDGTIWFSPDGRNLGGGGLTTQSYGGPNVAATLVAFETGVVVSFSDGNGSVFYSPDGTNLYGGGSTQLVGNGNSGNPPASMAVYRNNLITVWPDDSGVALFLSDGLNLMNQSLFYGFADIHVTTYGATGVLTALYNYLTGVCTTYYSPDGQNLVTVAGNTSQVYSGASDIVTMIPYSSGVITAFDDGTIYYSPDATDLKGGANTLRVYGPGALPIALVAYGTGVITAFPVPSLLSVNSYAEKIWYANPTGSDPSVPPSGSPPPVAIPIPHTELGFTPALAATITSPSVEQGERARALVRYAWQDAGALIAIPSANLTGTQILLTAPVPAADLPLSAQNVLVSDGQGNGAEGQASVGATTPTMMSLAGLGNPPPDLVAPLSVLFNLLSVSRGQTVANEILGSGDSTIATGQEFVLQKSPLTYLQSGGTATGYKSTLQVYVDGVEWQEVQSFYGQSASATVFVTSEDNQNKTHVQFGDGVYGARLPSGTNNVVAVYRYGSGAAAPDAGSLSVITKSWPGLKSVVNPVPAGGGADPDPPQQIKTYAPQSVLTFGRAISADDYEAIAAEAPGVVRARAYWSWDAVQQRRLVKVYVGDDQNAVKDARTALAGAGDPNRPVNIILATPVPIAVTVALVIDNSYVPANVVASVTSALIDPDQGLFGLNAVRIGESVWESQIYAACQSVAGVVAVHGLQFSRKTAFVLRKEALSERVATALGFNRPLIRAVSCQDIHLDPGEGGYFQLAPADLTASWEVAANGG